MSAFPARMAVTAPAYRPVRPADLPACLEVFYAAEEEFQERLHQPRFPRNPKPLVRLWEHLLATDPESAWLAEADGAVIGFGLSHRRGPTWFLSFLFVLPDWQGRGIGRDLLERCLPPAGERHRLGTCVEAIQPVSTALYASLGMAPRTPVYLVLGEARRGALLPDPDLEAVPFTGSEAAFSDAADELARLDGTLLGYERPQDHAFLRDVGRLGFLYHRSSAKDPVGYGYVQPSGRVGPIATLDPIDLTGALAHLMTAVRPAGGWQVVVPGPASDALATLLRAGLRLDASPAIFSGSWPGPPFDRYLPINFALL